MIDRGDFTNGEAVADSERALGDYTRRTYCVGASSGLDGLRLSLIASGLAQGARVSFRR